MIAHIKGTQGTCYRVMVIGSIIIQGMYDFPCPSFVDILFLTHKKGSTLSKSPFLRVWKIIWYNFCMMHSKSYGSVYDFYSSQKGETYPVCPTKHIQVNQCREHPSRSCGKSASILFVSSLLLVLQVGQLVGVMSI